jgi:hypothetical protein
MESLKERDREHDFELVLTGITELTTEVEDALFEAGCDDATLSARSGQVFLTFSRTAPTREDAIQSAIRDVQKANIGATPQLVGEETADGSAAEQAKKRPALKDRPKGRKPGEPG